MKFSILGPLEVADGGRRAILGAGQQRKLLAILLVHANEAVARDRLVDELWGDHPPDTAAKALQGLISQLRKALGHEIVLTESAGYRLRVERGDLDALRFEDLVHEADGRQPGLVAAKLREALDLWRGPALTEFAYDDFARAEIGRLEELRLVSLEKRIEADLALGRHTDLVGELEALVAEHPLRERLRAQLMLALYRSGRQAEGLDVYQTGRRILHEQLGLEPSVELQDLQRAILGHDEALAPPPRVPLPGEQPSGLERLVPGRRRSRQLVAAGVVLLAGAVSATVVELTTGGGTSTVTVVPNSVAIIDPATNRVVGDVPVGERPTAVAVGAGGVWVANADDGTVARIDPKSYRVVKTIGVGADVTDIAIGFGSVWVADGNDGTITRIDPRLNAIVATLNLGRMDPMSLNPVFFVAIGPTRVWASRGGRVLRIDPTSNEVDERIPVGNPIGLATGADSVFVTTLDERVLRIDPGTAAVTATYQLPTSAVAPLVTGGSLWLIDNLGHGEILRLDTSSLAVSGTAAVAGSPNNLATGEGSVWISKDDGSVVRIDRTTGDVTRTIRVGQRPTALAAGAGAIWIAVLQVPTSA